MTYEYNIYFIFLAQYDNQFRILFYTATTTEIYVIHMYLSLGDMIRVWLVWYEPYEKKFRRIFPTKKKKRKKFNNN